MPQICLDIAMTNNTQQERRVKSGLIHSLLLINKLLNYTSSSKHVKLFPNVKGDNHAQSKLSNSVE